MPLNIPTWRRVRDIAQLERLFPQRKLFESPGARNGGYWLIPVRPLTTDQGIAAIFEDLKADSEVLVSASGVLVHDSKCTVDHRNAKAPARLRIGHDFVLRVEYPTLLGAPRIWATNSGWTSQQMANHNHRYSDGSACAISHADT